MRWLLNSTTDKIVRRCLISDISIVNNFLFASTHKIT